MFDLCLFISSRFLFAGPIRVLNSRFPISIHIPTPKKKTKGRRKIPMERINNKTKRCVTFSKRRTNLFKKAAELSTLCGSEIAIIAFSEAGKAFTFGHPDPDSVIKRFLQSDLLPNPNVDPDSVIKRYLNWSSLQSDLLSNPNTSTRSVDDMTLEELQQYAKSLELELLKNNAASIAGLSNINCSGLKWSNQDVYAIDCEEGYVDDIFMPSSSPLFAPNNQNVDAANTSVLQQVQDGMDLYAELESWFAD